MTRKQFTSELAYALLEHFQGKPGIQGPGYFATLTE